MKKRKLASLGSRSRMHGADVGLRFADDHEERSGCRGGPVDSNHDDCCDQGASSDLGWTFSGAWPKASCSR
jgi:hypothetical protein